jgi:hypothetical protein
MGWQVKVYGLKTALQQRYLDFLKDVVENKKIYGIKADEKNWITAESAYFFAEGGKPLPVIPFWSSTHHTCLKYAMDTKTCRFKIVSISGDEFTEKIIPSFVEKQMVLGFNWDRLLNGLEYNAGFFLSHLRQLQEGQEPEFLTHSLFTDSEKFFGFDF